MVASLWLCLALGGWPGALVLAGAGIMISEFVMRYSVRCDSCTLLRVIVMR